MNKNVPKIQMPRGCLGGMLKLRFDWCIKSPSLKFCTCIWNFQIKKLKHVGWIRLQLYLYFSEATLQESDRGPENQMGLAHY